MSLNSTCPVTRALSAVGGRWKLAIVGAALDGVTRFAGFRESLGIAPETLADDLDYLVGYGVLARAPGEPDEYRLTEAGHSLRLLVAATSQWDAPGARPLRVAFADDSGREVPLGDIATA
jgi:DNA-binding HxlR family transcriptional regulator